MTFTVHTFALGMLALLMTRLADPATAVTEPPQLFTTVGTAAMITPVGSGSVTLALVRMVAVGFTSVMVKVDIPPCAMVDGEKDLLILGPCSTVSEAVVCAVLPPAFAVVTAPAGIMLL